MLISSLDPVARYFKFTFLGKPVENQKPLEYIILFKLDKLDLQDYGA
jgi:hypothetical protein